MFKKKPKKVLTPEEQELSIKKDLFWRLLFLMFFVAGGVIMNLSQTKFGGSAVDVIVIAIASGVVIFGPNYLYQKAWVREQYDIFKTKNWNDIKDEPSKARAKAYYNIIIFIALSILANPIAGVIAYFAFDKNNMVKSILTVIFIVLAFVFSIRLTERKNRQE